MIRNDVLARLTRLVALATTIAVATPALASDSIRVFVVKPKKNELTAPSARDAGFVSRSLAKQFGVKAPKGKASIVQIELPAAAWEANKVEIARVARGRGLAVVVSDAHPELGRAWAKGVDLEDRAAISLASEAAIEISMPGRNIVKLAEQVLLDQMADKVDAARRRHARGTLAGAPSQDEESTFQRPGKLDIDYGPGGAPIELDCEQNADDPACDLSPGNHDTDPTPDADDGDRDGDHEDVPFTRPDCNPFVDANCDGGDPCDLGLEDGHPLSDALGCGFADNVQDGAIGPRTGDYDVPGGSEVKWGEDPNCGPGIDPGTTVCSGQANIYEETEEEVCVTSCENVVCRWVTEDLQTTRTCEATGCGTTHCL